MTARMSFDDETLMAFADGELDDATADAVAQAIGEDEELRERAALFMDTRASVKNVFSETEAVPASLTNAVRQMIERDGEPTNVVSLDRKRAMRTPPAQARWPLALAASLASAIAAGVIGYQLGHTSPETADSRVARILDETASGETVAVASGQDGLRLRMLGSFRDRRDTLCREYELDRASGPLLTVSCREDDGWETRFAVAAPAADGTYAPASSTDALDTWLESIAAGPPLSSQEEEAALQELR